MSELLDRYEQTLIARPGLHAFDWQPGGYARFVIERTTDLEVALLWWPAGSSSPLHGHSGATAALRVLSGALEEHRYIATESGFRLRCIELVPDDADSILGGRTVHRVAAHEDTLALHLYCPAPEEVVERLHPEDIEEARRAWSEARGGATTLPDYLF